MIKFFMIKVNHNSTRLKNTKNPSSERLSMDSVSMVVLEDREVLDTGKVAWKHKSKIYHVYDLALMMACGIHMLYCTIDVIQ